jgi:hypothetical protein
MRSSTTVIAVTVAMSGLACAVLAQPAVATIAPARCLAASCSRSEEPPRLARVAAAGPCVGPISAACSLLGDAREAAGDVVGGVTGVAGDVLGAGAQVAGDAVLGGIARAVAEAAAWVISKVGRVLERSTRPDLGSVWFERQYTGMLQVAVALSLGFLLCALIHAALRGDVAVALRSTLAVLPAALFGCFAAIALVQVALALTDRLTADVLGHAGEDGREFLSDLVEVLATAGLAAAGLPVFVVLVAALLALLMAVVVWLELLLRDAAIYVAVAFLPLCLAGAVWGWTSHWARRMVEGLAAVILAKFTIAAALALAAAAMGHGRPGAGGFTAVLAGSAVMLIAALSPWVLFRLIPMGGSPMHRGTVRAAVATAPGAMAGTLVVRQAMLKSFGPRAQAPVPPAPPRVPLPPIRPPLPGTGPGGAPSAPASAPRPHAEKGPQDERL